MVPSLWCAQAFITAGCSPKKITVMPHGINPVYAKPGPGRPPGDPLKFLHVAAAPSFRQRKGTINLIRAFGEFVNDDGMNASLTLRCGTPDPSILSAVTATGRSEAFELLEDGPLEPAEMRRFYGAYDALVLPSRAEAFGLCALEARSQGLPVILTHAAGHAQHAEKWDTVIQHGYDKPIKVNGIPNGMAPEVKIGNILDALRDFASHARSRWDYAQIGASAYYSYNSWEKASRPLIKFIKRHSNIAKRPGLNF
jgi:glycosyltransferase involved in cell wall biosynthesis